MVNTNVLYIRIPEKLHKQLRELADNEGVSMTFMAITLLRDAFEKRERDEQLALWARNHVSDAERSEAS